jgi:hypothetical protein
LERIPHPANRIAGKTGIPHRMGHSPFIILCSPLAAIRSVKKDTKVTFIPPDISPSTFLSLQHDP